MFSDFLLKSPENIKETHILKLSGFIGTYAQNVIHNKSISSEKRRFFGSKEISHDWDIQDSVLLSLFMSSYGECNTARTPSGIRNHSECAHRSHLTRKYNQHFLLMSNYG